MEFEIKGVNYRTAKLDVFQQLKVSRKLLPVLAGLVSEFSTLKAQAAAGNSEPRWKAYCRKLPIRWPRCRTRTLTR